MREKGGADPESVQESRSQAPAPAVSDPYEELKKLKELLDLDIVTKEEFEAKKKKLLDL
jgi:BMFP domain-containing protein YqiC